MQEASASSSIIEQRVAVAFSEQRTHAALPLETSLASGIRCGLPSSAAVALLSDIYRLNPLFRASSGSCANHEQSSPHNKRVKFACGARPTRKSDALLLAAYPRRWA
jgi:hypothetical protein